MNDRKGDWLTTFRGKQAWPLDMRVEDIDVRDVAHHLALQCRFGGAVLNHYSVGEHLVRSSYVVADLGGDPLAGLGHDMQEYVVIDVSATDVQAVDLREALMAIPGTLRTRVLY